MLTVREVADQLNVSLKTVRYWIETGKIEGYRLGKEYRIRKQDFEKFLEQSKVAPIENDSDK